jgi:hypothetical protein
MRFVRWSDPLVVTGGVGPTWGAVVAERSRPWSKDCEEFERLAGDREITDREITEFGGARSGGG